MLFNSFAFLVFFALVTGVYYCLKLKARQVLLLLASCLFYMAFVPEYILILAITIGIDYFAGIEIEKCNNDKRRKTILIISILSTLLVLFLFKYIDFSIDNINQLAKAIGWNYSLEFLHWVLPIGLSFHTFQSLSYVIEVYRKHQKAERNFITYSLYVMFYPQLVAGPIERPQNLLPQLNKFQAFNHQNLAAGLQLMLFGLFKKVVIADRLAPYVDSVFNDPTQHAGLPVLLSIVFFSIQIYCDFSGYSDMAIGAARCMGYTLMRNFEMPYFATSLTDFWRRWHISLSTWFRDYLYYPLGGNKVGKWLTYRNLLLTFLISGIWHGANWNFVIWGAIHGIFLVVERFFNLQHRLSKLIHFIVTQAIVLMAWVFFRANSFDDAIHVFGQIFKPSTSINVLISPLKTMLCVSFAATIIVFESIQKRKTFDHYISSINANWSYAIFVLLIYCILIFGEFNEQAFIYFQF